MKLNCKLLQQFVLSQFLTHLERQCSRQQLKAISAIITKRFNHCDSLENSL